MGARGEEDEEEVCRKVAFHPRTKKARTIAGSGHELDVRGRNIGRGRSV